MNRLTEGGHVTGLTPDEVQRNGGEKLEVEE